jgi:hypothetical protein
MEIMASRLSACWWLPVIAASLLGACANTYDTIKPGVLKGRVVVEWIKPDLFVFTPDSQNPLRFVRDSKDTIVPARMLTDGGSIPRPLWILRNYSPWGYGPAFILHDWLFFMHQCEVSGHERYTLQDAADVMAEVMKTMMVSGKVEVDKGTLVSMHAAVSSPIAAHHWDHGKCVPPPEILPASTPIARYEFTFD